MSRYTRTKIKRLQKRRQEKALSTFADFSTPEEREEWEKQAALRKWLSEHQEEIEALRGKL